MLHIIMRSVLQIRQKEPGRKMIFSVQGSSIMDRIKRFGERDERKEKDGLSAQDSNGYP